jgi:hypothetical protein
MKKIMLYVLTSTYLLVAPMISPVRSEPASAPEESHQWLRQISFVTGYGFAPLDERSANYEVIPLLPQIGFDINPLAEKLHIKPEGVLEFIVEPVMNVVINPDTNAEVGCSLFLKYSDKVTSRIAPYIEGGLGMIYTTLHTHEQGTQYNFISQAGVGLQFFISRHFALTGGYRFRHLSNAHIHKQNKGIDHHFGILGVSYFFK